MSWHTLAWTNSLASATATDMTTVPDQIIQVQNTHFLPPMDLNAYMAWAFGTDLQRVQISTPRLRQVSNVYVRPIQPTLIGANDANLCLMDRIPLRFRGQEEIVVTGLQDNAGAQRATVCMSLGQNLLPVPAGDIYKIRATGTTTLTANAWTQVPFILESALPQGRYACVLAECITANAIACRLTFDGQYFRPGFPGISDVNQRLANELYDYIMGVAGYFVTYSLPRLEVLANGADTAEEIYFHVIPVAGSFLPTGQAV